MGTDTTGLRGCAALACGLILALLVAHQTLVSHGRWTTARAALRAPVVASRSLARVPGTETPRPGQSQTLRDKCPTHQGTLPLFLILAVASILVAGNQRALLAVFRSGWPLARWGGPPAPSSALLQVFRN